jgi:hypothetical protein
MLLTEMHYSHIIQWAILNVTNNPRSGGGALSTYVVRRTSSPLLYSGISQVDYLLSHINMRILMRIVLDGSKFIMEKGKRAFPLPVEREFSTL